MPEHVLWFEEIGMTDVPQVGGKTPAAKTPVSAPSTEPTPEAEGIDAGDVPSELEFPGSSKKPAAPKKR